MAAQLPQIDHTSLHVTIYIDPSNIDTFFESFTPAFHLVTAEPQCISFDVYQDPLNPGTISWVENWSESPEWLMNHLLTKDYMKAYLEKSMPLHVKEREVRILKRVDGLGYVKK